MKNRDLQPHEFYAWQIAFANGKVIKQGEKYCLEPVSPNRPPDELGQAVCISLMPQTSGLPPVSVPIPSAGQPVFHRLTTREMASGELQNLVFRVGWRLNKVRVMVAINSKTGHITLEMDS